jgi:hypothetical protein
MYKLAIKTALLTLALATGNAFAYYGTPPQNQDEGASAGRSAASHRPANPQMLDDLFRTSDFSATVGG